MKRTAPAKARPTRKIQRLSEFELIDKWTARESYGPEVLLGPGDDASAVYLPGDDANLHLQTADLLIEDVHFRKAWGRPFQLGWKALAVSLSDIAAMGGWPRHAHLALAIPPTWSDAEILMMRRGFYHLAHQQGVSLLGGDLSASPGPLVICVMVDGIVATQKVLRRDGAQAGDIIWVSGMLGEAAAGLRLLQNGQKTPISFVKAFLQPNPQIRWGQICSQSGYVHALIDISDGLAGDLGHILRASKVGAVIETERLPLSADLRKAAIKYDWDALDLALHGGEDYRLLGCTPPEKFEALRAVLHRELKRMPIPIGTIRKSKGLYLLQRDGRRQKIAPKAFDHFTSSPSD